MARTRNYIRMRIVVAVIVKSPVKLHRLSLKIRQITSTNEVS
jgi:hypothetical protein